MLTWLLAETTKNFGRDGKGCRETHTTPAGPTPQLALRPHTSIWRAPGFTARPRPDLPRGHARNNRGDGRLRNIAGSQIRAPRRDKPRAAAANGPRSDLRVSGFSPRRNLFQSRIMSSMTNTVSCDINHLAGSVALWDDYWSPGTTSSVSASPSMVGAISLSTSCRVI